MTNQIQWLLIILISTASFAADKNYVATNYNLSATEKEDLKVACELFAEDNNTVAVKITLEKVVKEGRVECTGVLENQESKLGTNGLFGNVWSTLISFVIPKAPENARIAVLIPQQYAALGPVTGLFSKGY